MSVALLPLEGMCSTHMLTRSCPGGALSGALSGAFSGALSGALGAQNPTQQHAPAPFRTNSQDERKELVLQGSCDGAQKNAAPCDCAGPLKIQGEANRGQKHREIRMFRKRAQQEAQHRSQFYPLLTPILPKLSPSWPSLPDALKAGIVAMIKAAAGSRLGTS